MPATETRWPITQHNNCSYYELVLDLKNKERQVCNSLKIMF